MRLSKAEYMAATAREGEEFASLICPEHLTAAVPGCPGWDLERLVGHMGRLYFAVAEQIRRRAVSRVPKEEVPHPPGGAEMAGWFSESLAGLLAQLESLEPDEEIWTWANEQTGGFYHRRMAHETAIHRWDAQSAIGDPEGFNGNFAADGVDEMLYVAIPMMQELRNAARPEGSLHLHRTDGEGEWLCWMQDGRLCVKREHGRADAAVRGTAEQLILALWERIGLEQLEVFGDGEVAKAWMAVSN